MVTGQVSFHDQKKVLFYPSQSTPRPIRHFSCFLSSDPPPTANIDRKAPRYNEASTRTLTAPQDHD